MNKGTGFFLTGVVAFASGLITGILLAPKSGKDNRKWIQDQSKEAKDWIEVKGQHLLDESERRISEVSKEIKKTVKEAVPDLYEATSSLHFDDDDIENE
tara:strand:- start:7924 stop:8220 length:297 start_codon:yes stop_codon:yes gene_type:complete